MILILLRFLNELLQLKLGWTEAALIAGAKDVGVSPAIIGSFPRKEAALVEVYISNVCLVTCNSSVHSHFILGTTVYE